MCSKAFSSSGPHSHGASLQVSFRSGAEIVEKFGIKREQYDTELRKLLVSVAVVGATAFLMVSTFLGSGVTPFLSNT